MFTKEQEQELRNIAILSLQNGDTSIEVSEAEIKAYIAILKQLVKDGQLILNQ